MEQSQSFFEGIRDILSDQNNTSGLLAVGLIGAVLVMVTLGKPVPDRLSDAALVMSGFYFGGATKKSHGPPSPH